MSINLEERYKHFCNKCQYGTDFISNYRAHLKTLKHIGNDNETEITYKYQCKRCKRKYKIYNSFVYHEKHCHNPFVIEQVVSKEPTALVNEVNTQNDIKHIKEMISHLMNIKNTTQTSNITNNIINTSYNNSNNNNNVFTNLTLNKECPNAYGIEDFANNMNNGISKRFIGKMVEQQTDGYYNGNKELAENFLQYVPIKDRPIHMVEYGNNENKIHMKSNNKWTDESYESLFVGIIQLASGYGTEDSSIIKLIQLIDEFILKKIDQEFKDNPTAHFQQKQKFLRISKDYMQKLKLVKHILDMVRIENDKLMSIITESIDYASDTSDLGVKNEIL
jgi:hypothetical protein